MVDASDIAGVRADPHGFLNPAAITDLYDFNRDGRVDATDQLIARQSINTSAKALQMFTAPAAANPGTAGPFTGIFNVKQFGARGDGATDDTPAIQSAINAMAAAAPGGLLYFPSGTYRISSFLSLQGVRNFEIRGLGATIMPLGSDGTSNIGGDILRMQSCSGFTLSGLTFDGDSPARTQTDQPASLRIEACSDFRIASCTFNNTIGDALFLCASNPADPSTAPHDGLIEGCALNSAFRNAISFIHGYRVAMQSNLIQNVAGTAPQAGIDIEANPTDSDVANHDITISGNTILNCAGWAVGIITTEHPTNVTVASNNISDCPQGVFNQGIDTRIDNNIFHDSTNPSGSAAGFAQVYCGTSAGQAAEITGNIFYSLTNLGAILTDPTWTGSAMIGSNRISGISGNGASGISVWSNGATITGNTILSPPGAAIAITANAADIENNTLTGGAGTAIYAQGAGQTIRSNTIASFPNGVILSDPSSGPSTALSAVDSNSFVNCPAAIQDSATHSEVNTNSFSSAALPASGPGSAAMAQVFLAGVSNGSAQVNGNTFNSISGMLAIYLYTTWSGTASVTNNQISNITGANADAISVWSNNTLISGNSIQNSSGIGIGVQADGAAVQNNSIATSPSFGIFIQGNGALVSGNVLSSLQVGIALSNPPTGGTTSAITTIQGNTITDCPTAVQDSVSNCQIISNNVNSASLPSSGPGSNAVAQVYLTGVTAGVAKIAGNTFSSLSGLSAIFVHPSWSGQATISSNQIIGVTDPTAAAIVVEADNASVTGNTLQNVTAPGIGVNANGADIENNTVPAGAGDGIYLQGNNATVRLNNVTGHPIGIEVTDPAAGGSTTATTTVDSNTVSNCPTAIKDTTTGSSITNNILGGAILPASGPGSDARAQIYLAGIPGGRALISGNTISTLTGLEAILVHPSWSGSASITSNSIQNITSANGIEADASNTVITANTLQSVGGIGIGVSGNGDNIQNNNLTTGTGIGIYAVGMNHTINDNTLIDFGNPLAGDCIVTADGSGGTTIAGNTIRKTVPNPAWIPIVINSLDNPGVNYRYGVQGPDGAFTLSVTAAVPGASVALQPPLTGSISTIPTSGVHWRYRLHTIRRQVRQIANAAI